MEQRNLNIGLLIFRLNFGVWMLFHGVYKLINGIGGIKGMLADIGLPHFLAYGVHMGETLAPILMILGYRTKLASLVYTLVMIVAFGMAHFDNFFELGKSGAWAHETIALFLFGGLGLTFTGAGKYALSSIHKWD
ncbi:DoxX family protein [Sphingobacterium sp. SGG-5]|uniref:DoxX family protein n=1 Tax=Sphingobacterium sp. SGG-5 TaxID=2710881 RepID=UPI0013ECB599|nr:DoxX family protein [Sphingobacterium sp. SGG-5]NGM62347.1 DoxX family protein [Sphingobacterium sp. SGG-5]